MFILTYLHSCYNMLVILGLACSTSMSDLVYQLSFLFEVLIEVTKSSKRVILWNIIDAFRFEVKKTDSDVPRLGIIDILYRDEF